MCLYSSMQSRTIATEMDRLRTCLHWATCWTLMTLVYSSFSFLKEGGVLGEEFIKLGIIEEIISVLRNVEPSSEFELQLVAAGICALASLCLYDIGKTLDIKALHTIRYDNKVDGSSRSQTIGAPSPGQAHGSLTLSHRYVH